MKIIAAILTVLLAASNSAHADHELTGRNLSKGKELYNIHCASCHGTTLKGQPNWQTPNEDGVLPAPPHDRTGHTWHHDNLLLFEYTKLGGQKALEQRGYPNFKSGMQGFAGTVTDDQIWDVLAYIRSTWPEQEQMIQSAQNPAY